MSESISAPIFVYVTCGSSEEAGRIVRHVVGQRLAACANILPGHQSWYWWQGKLEQAAEAAIIFKTRNTLFESLRAAICEIHSYDCPCIVALPITDGHQPYLQWLLDETAADGQNGGVKV